MKKFLIVLSVLLILLILIAAGGLFGAFRVSQLDTNYPNLTLNGLQLGGLTKAETVAALNASGWDTRISTPLTVTTLAGQSFTAGASCIWTRKPCRPPSSAPFSSARRASASPV